MQIARDPNDLLEQNKETIFYASRPRKILNKGLNERIDPPKLETQQMLRRTQILRCA